MITSEGNKARINSNLKRLNEEARKQNKEFFFLFSRSVSAPFLISFSLFLFSGLATCC